MKRSINTANLTKDFIESKVSQISIMSKYLDIPVEVITDCIEHNRLITSVFRDNDTNKSMGFAYNKKGKLKVRDFGGVGTFMDVYDTVAYVLSLVYDRKIETNKKQDFYFILKHIAYTFSEEIDGTIIDANFDISIQQALRKGKSKLKIIEIVPRSWNKQDKNIWNHWGVNLNYLNTNFVIPVEQYYIDRSIEDKPKYYYKSSDPCYAYVLGQNNAGVYLIKLYFPLRNRATENKFITNCNVLEGLPNLELDNYDYILITKSSKDRLSIGCHLASHSFYGGCNAKLNIGIINLPSENYELNQKEYDFLLSKLKEDGMLYSLLDFDSTGRKGAKYLKDVYNIPYLFITRGEFGLPNYHAKDFADLHDIYKEDEINTFINDTISYAEREERLYTTPCLTGLTYATIDYRTRNGLPDKKVIMTYLTEQEEQLLDEGKTIIISRKNTDFTIRPIDLVAYGKIDYSDDSEDLDTISQFNWFRNDNKMCGFVMPSEYDYKTHSVTSDIKGGRKFDTTQCDIVAQYIHGCIGKPERTIIFNSERSLRKYVDRT